MSWTRYITLAVPAAVFCMVTIAPACSRQAEGERCDRLAGESDPDSDCADGLVCTDSQILGTSSDICCPPPGSDGKPQNATELACIANDSSGGVGGSGGSGGQGTGAQGGAGAQGGTGGAGGQGQGQGGSAGGAGGGASGGAGGN